MTNLEHAKMLARLRDKIVKRLNDFMDPIYKDLLTRLGDLRVSAEMNGQLESLRQEVQTWPDCTQKNHAMSMINWVDREA